ncbi:MAG: FkbM family methyltransferase [Dehalococcoidia bacterium]
MEKDEIYASLNRAYFSEDMHERVTIDKLPQLLRSAAVFVDIGASLGQYTYNASRCMNGGRIIAVEPDSVRFERLVQNCRQWGAETGNTIEPWQAAICDLDGTVTFHITNSPVSGGLFKHATSEAKKQKEAVVWEEITVPSYRLDTLLTEELPDGTQRFTVPDLVKIDVEGSESRVLAGCPCLLAKGKTKFLIEIHKWRDPGVKVLEQDVFKFMRSHGYYGMNIGGRILFVKRTGRSKVAWLIGWPIRKSVALFKMV